MRIVCLLRNGPRRFNEIQKLVGMSRAAALSSLLKKLQRDGVLIRNEVSLGPPAVISYALTDLGRELSQPMTDLAVWLARNETAILASRAAANAERDAARAEAGAAAMTKTTRRKRPAPAEAR
jgi:DNA-binding HxlR family transcriptional regulator